MSEKYIKKSDVINLINNRISNIKKDTNKTIDEIRALDCITREIIWYKAAELLQQQKARVKHG